MTTHPTDTPLGTPIDRLRLGAIAWKAFTESLNRSLDHPPYPLGKPPHEEVIAMNDAAEAVAAEAIRTLETELSFYESQYAKSVEAAAFMQDEQEELGLRIGQRTTVEGVIALRKQRDDLRALLRQKDEALREAKGCLCAFAYLQNKPNRELAQSVIDQVSAALTPKSPTP